MTAYGLLSIMAAGRILDGLPIVKWLLKQQNNQGGFQSTQDTVVGLQALGKFTEYISTNKEMELHISYTDNVTCLSKKLSIQNDNALVLQTYQVKLFFCYFAFKDINNSFLNSFHLVFDQ